MLLANSFESLSTWECKQSVKKLVKGKKIFFSRFCGTDGFVFHLDIIRIFQMENDGKRAPRIQACLLRLMIILYPFSQISLSRSWKRFLLAFTSRLLIVYQRTLACNSYPYFSGNFPVPYSKRLPANSHLDYLVNLSTLIFL